MNVSRSMDTNDESVSARLIPCILSLNPKISFNQERIYTQTEKCLAIMHLIAFGERRGQPTEILYNMHIDTYGFTGTNVQPNLPCMRILQCKFRFGSTLTTFASFIL